MATMDLLKATVNGKLGNVYGARQRAKTYIKAVPFSHSPHSKSQTRSVRAFEKLNRFSSGLAKGFWKYLGLSDKKVLKHNAVATLFKPMIANGFFSIQNIKNVIKKDGKTSILNFVVDNTTNTIYIEAQTTELFDKKNGSAWVLIVLDDTGYCYKVISPDKTYYKDNFKIQILPYHQYIAIAFRSDKKNTRQFLHGLSISGLLYVLGKILIIDNFPTSDKYTISGKIIETTDTFAIVDGNELVFNFN